MGSGTISAPCLFSETKLLFLVISMQLSNKILIFVADN